MVVQRTWYEVGEGPDCKGDGRHVPDHDGIACPFDDLGEVVGAGNIPEQSPVWDLVTGAGGFPQPDEHIIRPDVVADAHTKDDEAGNKLRTGEPFRGIAIRIISPVVTQEKAIYSIKKDGHDHDYQGHFLSTRPEPEWKNEHPVQIMDDEGQEKDPDHPSAAPFTAEENDEGY